METTFNFFLEGNLFERLVLPYLSLMDLTCLLQVSKTWREKVTTLDIHSLFPLNIKTWKMLKTICKILGQFHWFQKNAKTDFTFFEFPETRFNFNRWGYRIANSFQIIQKIFQNPKEDYEEDILVFLKDGIYLIATDSYKHPFANGSLALPCLYEYLDQQNYEIHLFQNPNDPNFFTSLYRPFVFLVTAGKNDVKPHKKKLSIQDSNQLAMCDLCKNPKRKRCHPCETLLESFQCICDQCQKRKGQSLHPFL